MMLEFARRPFCPMVDDTLCTPTSSQAGRGLVPALDVSVIAAMQAAHLGGSALFVAVTD
jgi:hypothetical protein